MGTRVKVELAAPGLAAVRELSQFEGASISIYLPPYRTGSRQPPSTERLQMFLKEAAARLTAHGVAATDGLDLMEPLYEFANEPRLAQDHTEGVAIFRCSQCLHLFWLPWEVEPAVYVEGRFHVTPILARMHMPVAFYLLVPEPGSPKLIRVSHAGPPERVPLQWTGNARLAGDGNGKTDGGGAPKHLTADALLRDGRLSDFYRALEEHVEAATASEPLPVVLYASDEQSAAFLRAARNPHRIRATVRAGQVARRSDLALVTLATTELTPLAGEEEQAAVRHLLRARDAHRVVVEVREALRAAVAGRVHQVFIDGRAQMSGNVDLMEQRTPCLGEFRSDDDDLLNAAAVETLRHGGSVWVVPPERMPVPATLAAELR